MTFRAISPTEDQIHRSVWHHIRLRKLPDVVAFHAANGGSRHPAEAAKLRDMGVVAGVADLVGIVPGQPHGKPWALELKRRGQKPRPEQQLFLQQIEALGGFSAFADNVDDAVAKLEAWGVIKPAKGA